MIHPKRYEAMGPEVIETQTGEFVLWEDYTALLEKVRKIAAEVIKERKSAVDWHARMSDDYNNPNGSAMGQDVVEASASLQAWEKAEELLKDFAAKEGKQP